MNANNFSMRCKKLLPIFIFIGSCLPFGILDVMHSVRALGTSGTDSAGHSSVMFHMRYGLCDQQWSVIFIYACAIATFTISTTLWVFTDTILLRCIIIFCLFWLGISVGVWVNYIVNDLIFDGGPDFYIGLMTLIPGFALLASVGPDFAKAIGLIEIRILSSILRRGTF